ncbi:hypothetical protein FM042_09250 [Aliidiomarina halalkaliphila]|uniref:Uncharacterized protein n=1 Tax=Aliidiomarina halalkaliphila TaxID=2593535 RepID=A0A552X097_9GAMM|nr:hypothetical protein [Aliidiomarina halalkaliphila]TRW48356.1 hypothetical protein FM042_09250 [Aliidiomarina halalkaliphila]
MSIPITSSQKWIILGVKALITAIALIPAIRNSTRATPGTIQEGDSTPFKPITGAFSLVFLGYEKDTIATVQLDYATASHYFVNKQKIQSLARYYRAYAVAIHCDEEQSSFHGVLTRQQVLNIIAEAMREIGVNIVPDMNVC